MKTNEHHDCHECINLGKTDVCRFCVRKSHYSERGGEGAIAYMFWAIVGAVIVGLVLYFIL